MLCKSDSGVVLYQLILNYSTTNICVFGQHEQPNVVEDFQDLHDMDRSIYPVIDCVLNVAHFYTDFVLFPV